eukprot:g8110.t1
MADEEDYLDLVIAGELVSQWLEVIDSSARAERVLEAAEKLKEGIERSEAYIEEALEENALSILRKFLSREIPEWNTANSAVQRIVQILEEYETRSGSVTDLHYGEFEIRIRQGALLDGLGARLWNVAHSLNHYIANHMELIKGKTILELGSGCGSSGILAATMSQESAVFLTDCVPSVLENLRASCRLNIPKNRGSLELKCVIEQMNDDLIESTTIDGESLDGVDDLFTNKASWEVSNMFIRFFDWQSDVQSNTSNEESSEEAKSQTQPVACGTRGGAPVLGDEKFDLILASEVLYEESHPILIASVLRHRLKHNGLCLIAGAVRDQSIYNTFNKECKIRELKIDTQELNIPQEQVAEYEGGIVLMRITHQLST